MPNTLGNLKITQGLPVSCASEDTACSPLRLLQPYGVSFSAWTDDEKMRGMCRFVDLINEQICSVNSPLTLSKSEGFCGRFSPARWMMALASANNAGNSSIDWPRVKVEIFPIRASPRRTMRFWPMNPFAPVIRIDIIQISG